MNKPIEHYEMAYSMQLFQNPKNFEVQQYYIYLLEKPKNQLSIEELDKIIEMYRFAIRQSDLLICWELEKKLQEYQVLLAKIKA